jgi:peptidoglycan/LPS O-acetylase OafA/YrhL
LLLGCALGAFQHVGFTSPRLRSFAAKAGPCALLCLAFIATREADLGGITWLDRGGYTLVALLASVLVLSCDGARESWWSQLLAARPLAGLGRISYGFYLWHYPVSAIGTRLVGRLGMPAAYGTTVAISIGLAALSYRLIELPFQRGRPRWASGAKSVSYSAPIESR